MEQGKELNRFLLDRGMRDLNPLVCGEQACPPRHRYGPAVRRYYLLHYVLSGCGCLMADGTEYPVHAGEFFLIYPGEVTTYEANEKDPWHYVWIGFDGEGASRLSQMGVRVGQLPMSLFAELYAAIADGFSDWVGGTEEYIASFLHRIMAELQTSRTPRAHYARRAETYIRTMYMQNISVEGIANALSLDRRYLTRLFKKRYGMTVQEYLIRVRLETAADLLRVGHSVAESATLSGYTDVSNFSKMFRRRFGVSPGAYADTE